MRKFSCILLLIFVCSGTVVSQDLGENYISEWKKFYPSKAVKSGMRDAVFEYENRDAPTISKWLVFNKRILIELSSPNAKIHSIDNRLLRVQAQSEIDLYEKLADQNYSLHLYSQLISNAIPSVLAADYLLIPEKSNLLCKRFIAIEKLSHSARTNLKNLSENELNKGLKDLSKTLEYLQKDFVDTLKLNTVYKGCEDFDTNLSKTIKSIESLKDYVTSSIKKSLKSSDVLGKLEYDRRLKLYTDSKLTSTELAEMALKEIKTVKGLMAEVSKQYIAETYSDKTLPKNNWEIINQALVDMEKDAPLNGEDYLEFWEELADASVDFIAKNDIATLPKNKTLRIQTAPESAGPAARIGWVASAPPFDPNPMTVLNLPSIPDTLPKQEQIDFWASFNKPFNRMIVVHELFPGHYMQLKISRETPHPVRLLFPYGIYIEGWATFTEKVLLDAGWEAGNHLTLLAHLRKRLENANRSYTSVQVHCNNWNQDQVLKFSTETSLLAPQFAKSLWGRIMNSPMQLTSYFLGGAQFKELLKFEKNRLGDKFDLKLFMDTIMKAGPIPIDEFYNILETNTPD